MSDQVLIGKTFGQYKIVEPIGAGGMATIFKAYQASIDRHVAIKILPTKFADDPIFVQRFMREAKAIASLEHPHIVPVYDFGADNDTPYLVMRYIEGGTLTKLMNQPMPTARAVEIISNIARALDYAHSKGVIHRDVKPSNILVDQHGEVLLTDFGIAKVADEIDSIQLTQAGNIMGTPNYIAPEQANGLPADRRSDIYSLGVILYELLTGRPPYQGATPLATVLMHISEPLPPPRSINPNIDKGLEYVILTALDKDPDRRYQHAGDMAHALRSQWQALEKSPETNIFPEADLASLDTFVSPTPQPAPTEKFTWSLKKGVFLVILLLLIGGAIGIFQLSQQISQQNRPTETAVASAPDQADTPLQATVAPTPSPERADTPPAPTETKAVAPPAPATDSLLAGAILFREQFSSNERNWFTIDLDDGFGPLSVKLTNGRYRISREAVETVSDWQELPDVEFDNFVLSVNALPANTDDAFTYGLTFRSNSNREFYTFEVSNGGFFRIRLRTVDGWQVLVAETETAAIIPNERNQLAVKASGPVLSFFINGQPAITIEDQTIPAGRIGVLLNVEEGMSGWVEFDELTVREISNE